MNAVRFQGLGELLDIVVIHGEHRSGIVSFWDLDLLANYS